METVGQQKWGISDIRIFGELKESIWVLGWCLARASGADAQNRKAILPCSVMRKHSITYFRTVVIIIYPLLVSFSL